MTTAEKDYVSLVNTLCGNRTSVVPVDWSRLFSATTNKNGISSLATRDYLHVSVCVQACVGVCELLQIWVMCVQVLVLSSIGIS